MLKKSPNPDQDYQLWQLIHLVDNGMGRARENELRPFGITRLQAGVLFIVNAADGYATVSDLSQHLFRAPHTMNELVIRMEKQGLVKRVGIPGNKRAKGIVLTEQGKEILEAQNKERKAIHRIVSALSEDEQSTLRNLLEKLGDRVMDELASRPDWQLL